MTIKQHIEDRNGDKFIITYDPNTGIVFENRIDNFKNPFEYKAEPEFYEYSISVNVNDLDSYNEEVNITTNNTISDKIVHSSFKGEISATYKTSDMKNITTEIKNKMYDYILKEINEIENNIKKLKKEKNILKYLRKKKLKNINNE